MDMLLKREVLLKPLQLVCSVADKRHTLPVLSNVLVQVRGHRLFLTASDLEVELVGVAEVDNLPDNARFTVPAKKLLDICRSIPESQPIKLTVEQDKVLVRAGKTRFTLSSQAAESYPSMEGTPGDVEFSLPQNALKTLIDKTAFAMAQQDVRYYLNGVLLKLSEDQICAVATDGHRLAFASAAVSLNVPAATQVIIPRKGISELNKLLDDTDVPVTMVMDKQRVSATGRDFIFTSKLIEGRFPDYERVFPRQQTHFIASDRERLKKSVSMASILSNEKHRGVRLLFETNLLKISANNPEQEEAEVQMDVAYQGEPFEVGFNASYLLDVLNAIDSPEVMITLADQRSSALFEGAQTGFVNRYIIMPLQI